MSARRPVPVIATILAVLGVLGLCRLGYWQQERLVWKNNLQASLDREFARDASAITLTSADLQILSATDLRRGTLTGTLDFDHQILWSGQVVDGKPARYLLIPLRLKDDHTIFVVAGPSDAKVPTPTTRGRIDTVTGTARVPHWNMFTPPNVPEKNQWYRADPDQMAASLGLKNPLPVLFYRETVNYKLDAMPAVEVPRQLRNDHRQYSIFWYTMAVILAVMYGLRFWVMPRRSDRTQSSD